MPWILLVHRQHSILLKIHVTTAPFSDLTANSCLLHLSVMSLWFMSLSADAESPQSLKRVTQHTWACVSIREHASAYVTLAPPVLNDKRCQTLSHLRVSREDSAFIHCNRDTATEWPRYLLFCCSLSVAAAAAQVSDAESPQRLKRVTQSLRWLMIFKITTSQVMQHLCSIRFILCVRV